MSLAAAGAGLLGIFTYVAVILDWKWATNELGIALIFMILNVMHSGARLGRKVYLVDMASGENRAAYVAVSNTIIGLVMLAGGFIGLIGDLLGAQTTILILAVISIYAAFYIHQLPDVSEP